jgi:sec-independent protein translocase protein TatC
LRYRLISCIVAVCVGAVVAYLFKEKIFEFLAKPLLEALPPENQQLVFTNLYEAFLVYLKAAFMAGLLGATPVLFYELWAFISPGLHANERRLILPFVLFSSLFFVGGAIFGYYVVFPYGFRFLLNYGGEFVKPLPSMREYLGFAMHLLLAFGVVFEMPIFIFLLSQMGVVDVKKLKKGRRFAIPIIFTVAAILTPGPDPFSQLMMAVPLLALYEIGILVVILFGRKPSSVDAGAKMGITPEGPL